MTSTKKHSLLLWSLVLIAIYGIGVQPYFDMYLLAFMPNDINGFLSFKILVLHKFLLAFLILITAISTLIRKQITRPFLTLNITYSLTVIVLNALVLLGYNELNSFYYTDAYSIVRISQQLVWLLILFVAFRSKQNNMK